MIELGPGGTLTSLAERQAESGHVFAAALGTRGVSESESVMIALARLWVNGADLDWAGMFQGETRTRVSLPTYPFERQRHWIEPAAPTPERSEQHPPAVPAEPAGAVATEPPEMPNTQEHDARILERVITLFEDVSGMDLRSSDTAQSFMALGFDSLFMTQVSAAINREFATPVSFRQLSAELDSLQALAGHLAGLIAPEVMPAPPPNQTSVLTTTIGAGSLPTVNPPAMSGILQSGSQLEALVSEQLRLMGRQLELLAGGQSAPAAAAAPTTAPSIGDIKAQSEGLAIKAPDIDPDTLYPGKLPRDPDDDRPIGVGSWDDLDATRHAALRTFIREHAARTAASKAHVARYRGHHADPRTAAGFHRVWKEIVYPIVCERSSGARLWDLDGNEYIDLLNGFGPNFLGHSHPEVMEAISREMSRGFEIGPQQRLAGETSELVCEMTGMDRASFVCTGSEAVQAAVRCARTYTQRDKIVVFRGDYHGNFDEVLVRGLASGGYLKTLASAPGIPRESIANVIVLEYGHDSALSIIEEIGDQVAAVMVEPVQSRRPELQPREFLHRLRSITESKGALLIFDEVVTGFRCHPGGAQAHFGVRADLATYGKVAGGNLPLGIVAGRRAVMDTFDGGAWAYGDDSSPEAGVTFFAGTFVRQPFAIAASHAMLNILKREGPQLQRRVAMTTEGFVARVNTLFRNYDLPFEMPCFTSVMYLRNRDKSELASLLWYYLRHHGVFALEGFPSYMTASHTPDDIDRLVEGFRLSIERMIADGMLHSAKVSRAAEGTPVSALGPPVPGAKLGKDPRGNPAWYAPDPDRPGAYLLIT